jgi:hypothetical protein
MIQNIGYEKYKQLKNTEDTDGDCSRSRLFVIKTCIGRTFTIKEIYYAKGRDCSKDNVV